MNRHVAAIANRLSLRAPQRESLAILDQLCDVLRLEKDADRDAALAAVSAAFPSVGDFEREFPSLCFALATGVGKTRLMGAAITYLHLARGINNFFVLAPNLTIYNKLIDDFTPNTAKYVFKGVSEFAIDPPEVVTGDTYRDRGTLLTSLFTCRINIFNISKINSEVRGGKPANIKKMSEYLGQSYFDHLASLPDLVVLMDESHRYRASAGVRAINELRPILGLEFTATPFVETSKGAVPFKNVVYDYPLGRALNDGFVKEPAVVTREDFSPVGMSADALEQIKLEDGVRMHERVKVELETYALQTGARQVKPFMLVIARDTTHAARLVSLLEGELLDGRYAGKVIQVDSSQSGESEDKMVEALLRIEQADEPTEIVVHVNMLKEGWDVTNLYTIVPLRAANARTLIEQSIGRGLRLPYGRRTGVKAVDTLNIVAHDRFQEIVEEANKADSQIRLQQIVLGGPGVGDKMQTVVSQPVLNRLIGPRPESPPSALAGEPTATDAPLGASTLPMRPVFASAAELEVAKIAVEAIYRLAGRGRELPTSQALQQPDVQAKLAASVAASYKPAQAALPGVEPAVDIHTVVSKMAALVGQTTIDIPRISLVPQEAVRSGFRSFAVDTSSVPLVEPSETLFRQSLHSSSQERIESGMVARPVARLEDHLVLRLMRYADIDYDSHADLLYDLAGQVVHYLQDHVSANAVPKILQAHDKELAELIHAQMQEHFWQADVEYDVQVSAGFVPLKPSAFTTAAGQAAVDFRQTPNVKSKVPSLVYTGFARCLFDLQKFQSDTERLLAIILDRDAQKWFKPAKGQFRVWYRFNHDSHEYVPDFVAETEGEILLIEPKMAKEMTDDEVVAKRDAAVRWCGHATQYALSQGGKPWSYLLVPHDEVQLNKTLSGLVQRFAIR